MENTHQNEERDLLPPQTERSVYAIPTAVATVVVIGILLHFLSDAFLPFVAALFLANIFMPLVEMLRKKNIPTVFSILLVLVVVGAVLFGVVLVISTTVDSVIQIIPKYQAKWEHVLLPQLSGLLERISPELKEQAMNFNLSTVLQPSKILGAVSSVTALLSTSALVLLFMLFILASNGQFRIKIEKAFPPSGSFQLNKMVENIEVHVRKYLLTNLLINTAAGVTMTIVLFLFGVDLAVLWGVLTFFLMFIPSIGSVFAVVMPILVSFLQFDSIVTPLLLSITIIITQLIIGSVIAPKILGNSLNLSPLLILVSLIFWGWVWGPLGMILSVPITSTIAIIFQNIPSLHPLAVLMSSEPANLAPFIILKKRRGK